MKYIKLKKIISNCSQITNGRLKSVTIIKIGSSNIISINDIIDA